MSKKRDKIVMVVPTQWATYLVDDDVDQVMLSRKGYQSMPLGIMLETLVGIGKAQRVSVTGLGVNESIMLEGNSDFIGGHDAIDD